MSNQWDAIAALRARGAAVAGWGTTWPVAYAQRPFSVPAARQWIEEAIVGGAGVPTALTAPGIVHYRFGGQWVLTLITPKEKGERVTLDMAEAIDAQLRSSVIAIAGGTIALLLDGIDIGPAVEESGDLRRDVIVTYAFYESPTPGQYFDDGGSGVYLP